MILLYYDSIYINYPTHPDPATLRTIPHTVKGIVVYLTKEQNHKLTSLEWSEAALAIFVAINLLVNLKWPLPSKGNDGA